MYQKNTMIKNIFYLSRVSKGITQKDVVEICETSISNNKKKNITGYFMIVGNCFMQFIEGSPYMIDELLEKIEADPRHSEVTVFLKGYASRRYFPDWSMKFQQLTLDDFKMFDGLHNLENLKDLKEIPQVDIKLNQMMLKFYESSIGDNLVGNH